MKSSSLSARIRPICFCIIPSLEIPFPMANRAISTRPTQIKDAEEELACKLLFSAIVITNPWISTHEEMNCSGREYI
jgi:hypothetical protein